MYGADDEREYDEDHEDDDEDDDDGKDDVFSKNILFPFIYFFNFFR